MKNFTITDDDEGTRLDSFAAKQLQNLSRSSVQKLINESRILIDEKRAKPAHKLKAGNTVKIDFNPDELGATLQIELPIIYEDEDCVVINKPAGVLTHSKGAFNPEATVASFITPKLKGISGERGGIVHRLDRATSGVMICAKTDKARSWLQKQFSTRKVKKTYYAIIEGKLSPASAIIDMPIERHPRQPQTFRVGSRGKSAKTTYKTIKESDFSLIMLTPETGRTHQLRVHLNHLDSPIVGDILYGGKQADRLYLHAHSLEITLPNKSRKVFSSPLPESFNNLVDTK